MISQVTMQRELFGMTVKQKSKEEFFSATDLIMAGNKWRINNNLSIFNLNEYLRLPSTVEFIKELSAKYGEVYQARKGRAKDAWVHPYLFLDIALAISPTLKIEVYEWIFDNLLKYRNDSGDSYKKMSGFLMAHTKNKQNFWKEMSSVADKIRLACNVTDWQTATESQLKMRDKLHDNISLLADIFRDNDQAVRLAIIKSSC